MTTDTTTPDPAALIDTREAARRLCISTRTLWSLTHRGDLPAVRIGRRVMYRPATLASSLLARMEGQR